MAYIGCALEVGIGCYESKLETISAAGFLTVVTAHHVLKMIFLMREVIRANRLIFRYQGCC